MINVCQKILCPYFGEKGHNYGCQRYALSSGCHLKLITPLQDNEYVLYTDDEELLASFKVENDRFFQEDPKYAEDLEFQRENPELFAERSFKVREIQTN
ncbi:hypothetical protein ACN23B_27120 (plasmid) [Anabaena sp. FACHB-709]|uniref:Uncharacterized protein n=2 Tax=Nostocaceae TaxID=1162 RepID=A0A1Z4KV12_ANAVA|nr:MULTISPECIES: hypothetical protein [Nostocaceae]BAY72774.1 hypothetical protein NIES23_56020 [Trichormus variabilis NIES-23]MBD2174993.1 hypothetical protein [Anabaena cylindrica FACHB-318]MBD2266651.1 hypothetical protein [Anabaena sp. FACHB-709]MBD2276255.1 hypothetical protein [Nostoc sp. PCC 7120 = FACHB-418]MBD2287218.1 hypothetical protein [Anabaena cylindrica FACHB-170]